MNDCDVAVIGAGVIGAAVAFELVSRGASVTVLDARGAGLGSTQAAAGMLVPYLEGFGRPILPLAAASLAQYDAFVDRVSRDSGIKVGYHRTGSLQVAVPDDPGNELPHVARAAQAAGVACELLDSSGSRTAEPLLASEFSQGLLIPTHGFVVTADLSGALASGSIKYGARMMIPQRVLRIEPAGDRILIHLQNDRVTARHVVLAAGSWSGGIAIDGVPPLPVRPVRGQILQLAWDGPAINRIVWGPDCYLVPADAGTILVGATVEDVGFDERTTAAGVRQLLHAACRLIPDLRDATFVAARAGLRPATVDEMPLIGKSTKIRGLVYATGHYRNGVLLAPVTARAVADLVLENREDPLMAGTSPQRFGEY